MPKQQGRYVSRYFCAKCDELLFFFERNRNDGCCPHCGHIAKGTVAETVKRSVLLPLTPSFWETVVVFFKRLGHHEGPSTQEKSDGGPDHE